MGNDKDTELLITAKNVTTQAFKDVQAALKALADQQKDATEAGKTQWAGLFDKIAGGVAVGNLVSDAFKSAAAVLVGIPGDLAAVLQHGSDVDDVASAFGRMTANIGGSGVALAALREGTKNTVSDFDLMKSVNGALADGVQLTTDNMKTLAAGARTLAQSGFGSTKDAMDELTHAMETGKAKGLSLIGVHINADEALARYAVTIHRSVDDFTDQDKVAATAAETLRKLSVRLKETGDLSLDAGEKIDQGKVALANFEDAVARGIANSPVLAAGMDAAGTAIRDAFGGHQEEAVRRVVAVVEQLTVSAVTGASYMVEGAASLVKAYETARSTFDSFLAASQQGSIDALQKTVDAYQTSVDAGAASMRPRLSELKIQLAALKGYQEGFKQDAKDAEATRQQAEAARAKLQTYLGDMASSMRTMMAATKDGTKAVEEQGNSAASAGTKFHVLTQAEKEHEAALKAIAAAHVPLTSAQRDYVIENDKAGVSASEMGKALGISAEAIKVYLDSLKDAASILEIWDNAHEKMLDESKKFIDKSVADSQALALKQADASAKGQAAQIVAAADYREKIYQLSLRGSALEIEQINVQRDAELKALKEKFDGEGPLYDQAAALANRYYDTLIVKVQAASHVWMTSLGEVGQAFDMLSQTATGDTAAILQSVGQVTGALQNAVKTQQQVNASGGLGGEDSSKVKMIGNIALLATGYGAVAMAAFKAGKAIVAAMNDGRQAVDDFAKSMGGFDALHTQLLKSLDGVGEQFWIQLTQEVKRGDKAGAQKVIAEIQQAMANSPSALAAAAGFQTKADLQALADQAKKTYEYMRDSGLYTAATIADAFQKSKDATTAALGEEASAASAAMQKAHDDAKAVVDGLDQQLKSLRDSIANEAPEEVMGIVEANTRAQIAAITAQRKDAQSALEQVNQQIQDAADAAVAATQKAADGAGKATVDAIQSALDEAVFRARVRVETFGDGSTTSMPAHADGAYIREDHVARVHAGEIIGPADFMTRALIAALQATGGGGGDFAVAPLNVDGQKLADIVVRRAGASVRRFVRA